MNRAWVALTVLLISQAFAGDVFEHPQSPAQVQQLLHAAMPGAPQVEVLRGTFRQRKFLAELPQPLHASGEFLLVRGKGVWWHAQTPLDSTLTLTPDGVLQANAGAKGSDRGRAPQPGSELAAAMFFALFALDIDTLARSFELYALQADSHWVLGLRPRDRALARWFQQATLSGAAQVSQVVLYETAGDRTEIDLDMRAHSLSTLTPAEHQRFER